MDHNRGKAIDLTLRLGPSNPEEQDNQDPVNNELQSPPGVGIGNPEVNVNPPPQYGAVEVGPPNLFMFYLPYPLQNLGGPSRRRVNRVCKRCGSNNTPLWRKGPEGRQTLCNACGIKHDRAMKRAAR